MAKKRNRILKGFSRFAVKIKDFSGNSEYYDYNLLAVLILLIAFGLVILYSSSAYTAEIKKGDDMYYLIRQTVFASVSIVLVIIVPKFFDYHWLQKPALLFYFLAIAAMAAVLTPLGVEYNGARRWIWIISRSLTFQPAELAKIAVIILVPYLITKTGRYYKTFRGSLVPLLAGLLQAALAYLFTENMSTAIIIMMITLIIMFVAQTKKLVFFWDLLFTAFIAGGGILAKMLLSSSSGDGTSFRLNRILVWLHPEQYSDEGGYQILQGLYAIGSGGLFGKGLGNSTQKLGKLPEAMNDMIFSVVCEELGIFGGILLLILFGYLLYRLFFIAQNAPDLFGSLMVTGIFGHIALQVVLNICVVTNMIPNTGITMPFISYGGTALIFIMAEMAMALSVSRTIKFKN